KLLNIDRRWIFLLIGIVCIIPFLLKIGMPVHPTDEVRWIFDYIEGLGPENAIFVGFDFDPGTQAENLPMAVAIVRHAFSRDVPVFMTAFSPLGQGMIQQGFDYVTDPVTGEYYRSVAWDEWSGIRERGIAAKEDIVQAWEAEGNSLPDGALGWVFEGRDYALLGYQPLFHLVILGMCSSIAVQFPVDMGGHTVPEMPMLQEHKSLRNVDLAVTLAGSSACLSWITYGRERVGLPIAFGVTAVMATDYYIYIQSGQIVGQMGGLRGAAEYEVLLTEAGHTSTTDKAFQGMDVQSAAHVLILLLVLLGNIAFFAGGFHRKGMQLKKRSQ
ncbi:hypothetical protein JW921_00100, partial [Candidatus Fermentibacterales bacterium]|nr:hypothetical protein [Candidatus Fermentibacterales bacterium]